MNDPHSTRSSAAPSSLASALLLLFFVPSQPLGAQSSWPAWRGEDRRATVEATVEVPAAGDSPLWSAEVGNGQASPITTVDGADARIFVHSRLDGRETLQALSLDTGETLWKQAFEEPYEPYPGAEDFGKGPKATPAAAGGRVCALSVSGYVTCFRSSDGKLLWRKGFRDRFSKSYPPFGASSSPLFVDSALVVHVGGHPEGALLALDPETGRELWAYEGEGPGYSSPIVAELHGQRQIVTQAHKNIVAVAATTGELLWRHPSVTPCDQNVPTPVQVGDTLVFSSLDSGVFALRPRPTDEGWIVEEAWRNDQVALYMSSAVVSGDEIVGFSHKKRGQLFALDAATGDLTWSSDGGLGEHASLLAQNDRVFAFLASGRLLVVSPAGRSRLSEPVVVASEELWAHPVPTSHGWLLRHGDHLTLLGPAGPSDPPTTAAASGRPSP